ncbi:MAG: helix-turn-helix transcriptional regulator [Actinomycetota bacterium]
MDKKPIGDLIRKGREANGWTQAKLAKETGIPQASISLIETGARKRPRRETLATLVAKLGISEEELSMADIPSTLAEIASAIERYPGLSNAAKMHIMKSVRLWVDLEKGQSE